MKVDQLMSKLKKEREEKGTTDVLLLHLESFFNVQFSYYSMGLLYMATILRDAGYNVRCCGVHQLINMTPTRIRHLITVERPAIVGFYTVSDNICQVEEFAAKVKRWNRETKVVAGGPLPTSIGGKIMECRHFDFSVVGEGEGPMKMLADCIIKGEGSVEDIPGLIYRREKELVFNAPDPPIADLDSLPYPDLSLVGRRHYFHIVSGRGCPYNCIFCFQGVHGLKYRFRSADNIVGEIIENLESHDYKAFDIIDDTFISNPQRVKDVAKQLVEYREKSGKDFIFFCQGRVDIIEKNPEMLDRLKDAGLARVQIGLESGHPRVLETYKKKIDHDQTRRVMKYIKKLGGICAIGNFIIGGPYEDEETFRATVDLAKEVLEIAPGNVEVNGFYMGPYPGTSIAENPEKYGMKIIDNEFKKGLSLTYVHMTTDAFDRNGIHHLRRRFFDEIEPHMDSLVKKIPRYMLGVHYQTAWRYNLQSLWYIHFLQKREALKNFFDYLEKPRFKMLCEAPLSQLTEWHAQRVYDLVYYSKDGRKVILPKTTDKFTLTDPDEILIYELSSGKLNIGRMIEEYRKKTGTDRSGLDILQNVFIPVFKKLDEMYQVVFYK